MTPNIIKGYSYQSEDLCHLFKRNSRSPVSDFRNF